MISVKLRVAELDRLREAYSVFTGTLALKESAIDLAVDQGAITAVEAERRKFEARAESLPQLEAILLQMRAIAATAGEKNAIEGLLQAVAKLKDTRSDLEKAFSSSAKSGLAQFFSDIETGSKSGKAALLDMVGSFAKSLLDVINKRLADQLVTQFLNAIQGMGGGSGSGIGGFVSGLFGGVFHTGGVVGAATAGGRAVSPALFAYAPRYHSGGIAGLRPNEVPAILQPGEEVLTADDPRHVRNASRSSSGNTINISVSVTGADGKASDQATEANKLAEMLGPYVETKISQWATTQRRQGGMFAGSR